MNKDELIQELANIISRLAELECEQPPDEVRCDLFNIWDRLTEWEKKDES